MTQPDVPSTGPSRRDLLKCGAVVGAVAAWTVPLVQVVSMTPAHADSPSAPPVNPPPVNPPPVTPPVNPPPVTPPVTQPVDTRTPVAPPPATPQSPSHHPQAHPSNAPQAVAPPVRAGGSTPSTGGQSTLASTGVSYPVAPTVGAGVAAIALGTGALAAAHAVKMRQESSSDA